MKMVLEEEELFLSIRNPVEWEVKISGKTAAAAKEKSGGAWGWALAMWMP